VSREGGGRPGKLAGRVAVVTGGGSGLGRAGVLRFAAEGAKAATGALQPGRGAEPAAQIAADGGDAFYLGGAPRAAEAEALVTAAGERWGRVDILYASAGVMTVGTAPDTSEEDYQLAVEVNLGSWYGL
jgi:NAD(P)-dependent dehydrogenase (short-subunit alcohol dehydrogenase family)